MATIAQDTLPEQISPPIQAAVRRFCCRTTHSENVYCSSSCSSVDPFCNQTFSAAWDCYWVLTFPWTSCFILRKWWLKEGRGSLGDNFCSCHSPVFCLLSGNNIKCSQIIFSALILTLWYLANGFQSSSVLCNWMVNLKYHTFYWKCTNTKRQFDILREISLPCIRNLLLFVLLVL